MLEKVFTTKMSADKKKLESRFQKIRTKNGKLSKWIGIGLFSVVILAILVISIYLAVTYAGKGNPAKELYELRNTSLQDAKSIQSIVYIADITPYPLHSTEVRTDSFEKRIAIKFMVDDRSQHRVVDDTALRKLSAILLSLVPEADSVSCLLFDRYSEDLNNWETSFYSTYVSESDLHSRSEFERFTKGYLNDATKSLQKYEEFYRNISLVSSQRELSNYMKQIYSFIGNDYELVSNSGLGAEFLVDHEFLASRECAEIRRIFNIKPEEYLGRALQLNKHTIRNFKNNIYKKHLVLCESTPQETTMIAQKIIEEEQAEAIRSLIGTLMEKTADIYLPNAENLTYTQALALQYQANQGHYPWRLDPKEVIQSFLSARGESTQNIRFPELESDSLHYVNGNIELEVYQPIEQGKQGIWVVKSYLKKEPPVLKDITFYEINPQDNTLGEELIKREDGWYQFPTETGAFINLKGGSLASVTAYFTPTGTNMEQYKKQVGYAEPPFPQIPISIKLQFTSEDTTGHLQFVCEGQDGSTVQSEYFNVLITS